MLAFAAKILLLATIPVLKPGEKVVIDTAGMRVEENKLVNYHVFGYLRDMPPAMTALHSNEIVRSTHPFWDSVRLLPSVTASELPPTVELDTTGYPEGEYQTALVIAELKPDQTYRYKGKTACFVLSSAAKSKTDIAEGTSDGFKWKAFHNGEWLCVSAERAESDASPLAVNVDPAGDGLFGYRVQVSPDGAVSDLRFEDDNTGNNRYVTSSDWLSGAKTGVAVANGVRRYRVAIPFGAIGLRKGKDGQPIGLDFGTERKPSAYTRHTIADGARIAHDWTLALMDEKAAKTATGWRMDLKLSLSNNNAAFHVGTVRAKLVAADGRTVGTTEEDTGAVPKRPVDIAFPFDGLAVGDYTLLVDLVSPGGALETQLRRTVSVSYEPYRIRLSEPAYRDCVFETMKLTKIAGTVFAEEGLGKPLEIRLEGPETSEKTVIAQAAAANAFEFAFANKPKGVYTITAGTAMKRIRNLPYRPGEVWFDATGVMHRDGRKEFPIGWFSDFFHYPHKGVNVTQSYWNSMTSEEDCGKMNGYINRAVSNGCWYIVSPFQSLPGMKRDDFFSWAHLKGEFGVGKVGELQKKAVRRMVETVKDNPGFLAYYLADEPEGWGTNPKFLKAAHDYLQELDPYHPTIVVDYGEQGVVTYHEAGDVMAPDAYPVYFTDGTTRDRKRRTYVKAKTASSFGPGWLCPQVFDWHITMKDKPTSRGPTYDEIREQCLTALAGDVRGFLFYGLGECGIVDWHFWLGSEAVIDELLEAKDAFLAPSSDVAVKAADGADIVAAFKSFGDDALFIVVNCAQEKVEATFSSVRFPKEMHLADVAEPVPFADGRLTTVLAPYESRVYRTKPWKFSPAAVRAEIAKREAARRKPGNLAAAKHFYTMQEQQMISEGKKTYDFPRIVASSSSDLSHRPHVFPHFLQDGFDIDLPYVPYLAWQPQWPDWNAGTAWVKVEFGGKKTFSRAVLTRCRDKEGRYPLDSGWFEANGKKVAEFKGATTAQVTVTFDPVEADSLTFHLGPIVPGVPYSANAACLTEFEVYEK